MALVERRPMYMGNVRQHGIHAGRPVNAAVFVDNNATGERIVVVSLNSGAACTVMDADDYTRLSDTTWSLGTVGYVFNTNAVPPYLHMSIMERVGDANSVDHINRIKTDNRRRNLRPAHQSLQNSNRQERCDRMAVQPALKALGIHVMPRHVRYDAGCERFSFGDSPILMAAGVAAGMGNGTRCSSCSLPGKYLDCLRKYLAVHEDAETRGLQARAGNDDVELAHCLINEYVMYTAFAHSHAPSLFPEPLNSEDLRERYVDDVSLARQQVAMLEATGVKVIAGSANIATTTIAVTKVVQEGGGDYEDFGPAPEGATARVKGERMTLIDSRFESELDSVNWDVTDGTPRVHMSTALLQRWPQLSEGGKKRWLGEIIWVGLAGRGTVPPGSVLVPLNWEFYDVRLDNLVVMPGDSGKNYKRPESLDMPQEARNALGMRFIPRGITLCADPPRGRLVLVQLSSGGPKKRISVAKRTTMQDALCRAVEYLREQDKDAFDERNKCYQRLMREWRCALHTVSLRSAMV